MSESLRYSSRIYGIYSAYYVLGTEDTKMITPSLSFQGDQMGPPLADP